MWALVAIAAGLALAASRSSSSGKGGISEPTGPLSSPPHAGAGYAPQRDAPPVKSGNRVHDHSTPPIRASSTPVPSSARPGMPVASSPIAVSTVDVHGSGYTPPILDRRLRYIAGAEDGAISVSDGLSSPGSGGATRRQSLDADMKTSRYGGGEFAP